jgi:hypothetical protein
MAAGAIDCAGCPGQRPMSMSQATFTTTLTIAELEASFPLYLKALRILVREVKPLEQIKRSVCWQRLASLHQALPSKYRHPDQLYFHLKREINP